MQQIHIDRLKKLSDHLKNGQLGHEKFDFGVINCEHNGHRHNHNISHCGTLGCAAGELPIVFKNDWRFDSDKGIKYIHAEKEVDDFETGMIYMLEFFNISIDDMSALFIPSMQSYFDCGIELIDLYQDATKEQVANNIDLAIGYYCKKFNLV